MDNRNRGSRKQRVDNGSGSFNPRHYMPPQQAKSESGAISAHMIFDYLRRCWRIATPIGLVLATIGVVSLYVTFVPVYRAAAWLKIKETGSGVVGELPTEDGWLETQMQIIRGPLVMDSVLEKVGGLDEIAKRPSPKSWLASSIDVRQQGRSHLYEVSLASPNREDSVKIVDAVLQSYYDLQEHEEAGRMHRVIELLDQEKERRGREVKRLRESLRELVKQVTGNDPTGAFWRQDVVSLTDPLNDVERQISDSESQAAILQAKIKAEQESVKAEDFSPAPAEVKLAVDQSSDLQQWDAQVDAFEFRLERTAKALRQGKNDVEYKRLAEEFAKLKTARDEARVTLADQVREQLTRENANKAGVKIANLEAQLSDHRLQEAELKRRYQERRGELQEASGQSLEIEFARGDLSREQGVHDLLADRTVRLRTELGLIEPRVEVFRKAEAPLTPVEELPYKKMALAGLIAFCFPFALGFVWERTLRRISDSHQLDDLADFPIVGEVASLPHARVRGKGGRGISGDLGLYRESIDSIRTSLMLSQPLEEMQVISVNSAMKGEGKTSLATQLSVSLARHTSQPVLLIDADMRFPDIHQIFSIDREPGLTSVLQGKVKVDDAIVPSKSQYLDILPGGKLRCNPHAIATEDRILDLLEGLKKRYRYIVIDTPPVLAASEAIIMARCSDSSLLCVMRDRSRLDQVRLAHERLATADVNVAGAVLSGVPVKQYQYRYGSYYQERV